MVSFKLVTRNTSNVSEAASRKDIGSSMLHQKWLERMRWKKPQYEFKTN